MLRNLTIAALSLIALMPQESEARRIASFTPMAAVEAHEMASQRGRGGTIRAIAAMDSTSPFLVIERVRGRVVIQQQRFDGFNFRGRLRDSRDFTDIHSLRLRRKRLSFRLEGQRGSAECFMELGRSWQTPTCQRIANGSGTNYPVQPRPVQPQFVQPLPPQVRPPQQVMPQPFQPQVLPPRTIAPQVQVRPQRNFAAMIVQACSKVMIGNEAQSRCQQLATGLGAKSNEVIYACGKALIGNEATLGCIGTSSLRRQAQPGALIRACAKAKIGNPATNRCIQQGAAVRRRRPGF